jgi:hypothetical protein
MASVIRLKTNGRNGWRVRFYDHSRKRRELYLAGVSRKVAETVGKHCDELAGAKANNVDADFESKAWAIGTVGKLWDSLVAWELTEPVSAQSMTDAGRLLGPFVDAYIESRTDIKPNTRTNFKQCKRVLCEFFGSSHPIKAINAADAERWKRSMLGVTVYQMFDGYVLPTDASECTIDGVSRPVTWDTRGHQ